MKCAFFRRLNFVPILLLLFGCISQEAQLNDISLTPMNFEVTAPAAMAKVMVWGRSASGDAFAKVVDQAQVDSYEWYRNGDWTIYSIGWTGANLSGVVYCSRVERKFEGPKETNKIELSLAGCNHADFAGTLAGSANLGTTKLELCESVSGISTANVNCTDNLTDAFRAQGRGHAMSYRVTLRSFLKKGKKITYGTEKAVSACTDATPLVGTPDSGLAQGTLSNLPVGDGSTTPFAMQIEAFPGSATCDSSSHGSHTLDLPNGYRSQSNATFYGVDAGSAHKLYMKMSTDEICKGAALTQLFAGGVDATSLTDLQADISNASPRLICNETQFLNLMTNQYNGVKLLKDIDLRNFAKGVTTNAFLDGISLLLNGSNFFPLGVNPASLVPLNPATVPKAAFPYHFDGGGKTITGLRILYDPNVYATFTGLTSNRSGQYRRLRMVDWEIVGNENTSTLGGVHGGAIQVEVIRPKVRGSQNVGGLGHSSKFFSGSFEDIRISGARISGTISCGGMLGKTNYTGGARTSFFINVSVDGTVNCSGNFSGGILGSQNFQANFTLIVVRTKFEGAVVGDSYVGGIMGDYNLTALSSVYAHAFVQSTKAGIALKQGGLLGGSQFLGLSALNIDNSYFFGTGRHGCTAGDTTCLVGNLVGESQGGLIATNSFHQNLVVGLTATDQGTDKPALAFYGSNLSLGTEFEYAAGDIPRLKYETGATVMPFGDYKSACLSRSSVSAQVIAGAGATSDNPIMICNGVQVAQMTNYPDKHFRIGSPVYVHPILGNTTAELTGSIEGGNHPLFGIQLLQTVPTAPLNGDSGGPYTAKAWWKSLRGRVKNLFLFAPAITHTANTNVGALLALENYGKLENIRVERLYSSLKTIDAGGAVKGLGALIWTNFGSISHSSVSGNMDVSLTTAGFVFFNEPNSYIVDSSANVNMTCDVTNILDCAQIYGFANKIRGTVVRSFAGGKLLGNAFVRGNSSSSFAKLAAGISGTAEDIHTSGSSETKYYLNAGLAIVNQGILKRAYADADIKIVNAADPFILPITPDVNDYSRPANGGLSYQDPLFTYENILFRHPGRYYPGAIYNLQAYNFGSCSFTTDLNTTQWDVLTNPTYYFAAKDESPTQDRYQVQMASLPAGFLKVETSSCPAASPGTVTVGYETPAYNWQAQVTAPLSLTSFTGFNNHVNSLGETVWVADLNSPFDIQRVDHIRLAVRNGTAPSETPPTWVFDTTNGIRLWHRYLEE